MCLFERQTPNFTPPPHPSNSSFLPQDNSSSSSQTGETGSFGIPYRSPAPGQRFPPCQPKQVRKCTQEYKEATVHSSSRKVIGQRSQALRCISLCLQEEQSGRPGQGAQASFQPLPGHLLVPSEGNYHLAELPLQNTNTWLPGQHLARMM